MKLQLSEIVEQFQQIEQKLATSETEVVSQRIEQARLIVQVRLKCRKAWEVECENKLKMDTRVARRFYKVGSKWSTPELTPAADVLAKLPASLHKLEWLVDLLPDQLTQLIARFDLRKIARGDLIAKVKKLLGKTPQKKAEDSPTLTVLTKLDAFAIRLVKDVKALNDSGKEAFKEELPDLLTRLQASLDDALSSQEAENGTEGAQPDEEGEDAQEPGDEDAAGDQGDDATNEQGDEAQDEGGVSEQNADESAESQKEVPVTKPATKGNGGPRKPRPA